MATLQSRMLPVLCCVAVVSTLSVASTMAADRTPQIEMDPGYDWNGLYAGVQLGGGQLHPNLTFPAFLVHPDASGALAGVQAGYNLQIDHLVFGVEADIAATDFEETRLCSNTDYTCTSGADWMASLRGRAGVTLDRTLVYVTAGAAFLHYDGNTEEIATEDRFEDPQTLTGWTVGAGGEYAVSDAIMLGLEARYAEFDTATFEYDIPYEVTPDVFSVTARLSVKLGN
ncbi:outer membrane protein [Devosia sp.]|uniref:outer membrane protein n=1 Tax=Devosia sp. TaxID=1871048 RepID=UPI003A8FBCD8